jgi:pyruvate kinase
MEIPPAKVFLAQKMMIREANIAGKPVITATQMLESMVTSPRPTRAECSDVANSVLDGTDCVMLSGETANGPYFEQAVTVMARTCCEAESCVNHNSLFAAVRRSVIKKYGGISSAESLASSAVKTAIDVNAAIIVVLSESGLTARYIAKFRPGRLIVCLTTNPVVARQTGLLKGVHSYVVDDLADDTKLTRETGEEAVKAEVAKPGDLMVVVSGTLHGTGKNNQIRVEPIVIDKDLKPHDTSSPMRKLQSFVALDLMDDDEGGGVAPLDLSAAES